MRDMGRALVLAILAIGAPVAIAGQTLAVLHIRAVLTDATGRATPVARHALLIGDNPQTMETRRILTGLDGTANVRLSPATTQSNQTSLLCFRERRITGRRPWTSSLAATRPST